MVESRDTLKIVTYGHPTLRVRCAPITEFNAELRELAQAMHRTMIAADGVGLAASQVDKRIRLFVVGVPRQDDDEPTRLTLVNPEIVEQGGEWEYEEGCLSIPDVRDDVTRPEWIKLRYQDLDGKQHSMDASGLLGRVFQHELDHLNGVLFIDHLSPLKRALHGSRLRKLLRENEQELMSTGEQR
ncbi:peptide deformylase [candidate division KSB1 bacterium]|nr:peptide deformylase [candidate division KSB1 bacterium]